MKFFKKLFVLLICFLLLSGCGSAQNAKNGSLLDPQNPVTITLWHYYSDANKNSLETAIKEFNETVGLEKGIIVTPVSKESILALEEDITSSANGEMGSEQMPDIFSSYPDKAVELDSLGKVADLNAYLNDEEKSSYYQPFLEAGIVDEKMLLLPIVKSTEILYLNDTLWQEFSAGNGLTYDDLATWEGIHRTSEAYYNYTDSKTPDIKADGKPFFGFDSLSNFAILGNKQLGVEVANYDSRGAIIDKNALKKLYDFYVPGVSLGYIYNEGKFQSDNLKAQQIVSYVGSSSGAAHFPSWVEDNGEKKDINLKAIPYPVFEEGDPNVVQQGAGMGISNIDPQRSEASAIFLKWFTQTERNINFAMGSGYLPIKKDVYENNMLEENLKTMSSGDISAQNSAKVYDIATKQIFSSNAYAVKPFEKSYAIRNIFSKTLEEIGNSYKEQAASLKAQGLDKEQIIYSLEFEKGVEQWINNIKSELEKEGIPYEER